MEIYRRKTIPWRVIDEKALVVNPATSLIYPLNATAAVIWQSLDGSRDIKGIAEIICGEFEVEHSQALADIRDFIGKLNEAGLVEDI